MGGLLTSLLSLCELFWRFYLPRCPFSSLVGPYDLSHQFVQIEGEDRAGTCHLQRLPQAFLGLVEPIFVHLQPTFKGLWQRMENFSVTTVVSKV
jgi:hypothetical protein